MKKKILSMGLACVAALSVFSSCGNGNYKQTEDRTPHAYYSYTFDRFGADVMPIGGYIGPTMGFGYKGQYMESQITDYHYKQVSDAGLNFIIGMKPDYAKEPQAVMDSLKFADKNNVMYFVKDSYLFDNTSFSYLAAQKDFTKRLNDYKDHKAFAGIVCRDEPWGSMFEPIKNIQDMFYNAMGQDSNKLIYLNSLSYQCPDEWFASGPDGDGGEWNLDKYMTEWFKTFDKLPYYSYDLYPYVGGDNYIKTEYFKNLSKAKSYSEKNEVPFWTFIQAGGNFGGDRNWRITNEAEVLWQVNTSLAYGAKGYEYYPYNCPPESMQSGDYDEGLVNREGKKTAQWYYAQKANKQAQACASTLMKSFCFGVMQSGFTAVTIPEEDILENFREVVKIEGDKAIAGCFDYQGKTALYIVNNSITQDKAKVTVKFDGNYKFDVIQRGITITTGGKDVELTFAPGEAALIKLY